MNLRKIKRLTNKVRIDRDAINHARILTDAEAALEKSRRPETAHIRALSWNRFPLLRWAGNLAAALLIVSSLLVCFFLSREIAELRHNLEMAQRDAAIARTADSATINLYLREHQGVVARTASLDLSTPEPARMRVSRHDILYYEFLDDPYETMRPGIIVRGPSSQRDIKTPEDPIISNGHTLTLTQAKESVNFELVAPPRLHPCYMLDQIRSIQGRDAMQLLYTDGINSVSLFEQSLDGELGLSPQDFREYAIYCNKGQTGGTILAWRDDTLSYVLIGNIEMSQLMDLAQSISARNERE
ncbi:MAG: hypothetical protein ACYSWP_02325 [Planctomycetota bacterium]|jgi:hypothetical protein